MKTHRYLLAATGLFAALALTGCGGGSDDGPSQADTTVPDRAGVSAASFVGFIDDLSSSDETSEPLSISDSFTAPEDDSGEPTPLT